MEDIRGMEVRVVTTAEELSGLQPEWERLENQDPDVTFYSTFRVVKAWWDSFCNKPGVDLYIVCVYQNNKLAGIAPLAVIAEEKKNRTRKVLQFAGRGDYLNVLLDRTENPETVLKYMFKFLEANPSWEMILLNYIPGGSTLSIYLLKSSDNEYLQYCIENPYIDLKLYNDFADYKKKSLPSKVVKLRNKMQREVGFNFNIVQNNDDNIFERIAELHRLEKHYLVENVGLQHRHSLYEDPYRVRFIKNLFERTNNVLTFVYNDKEGHTLGYKTCYLHNRVLFSWNSAYNPRYAEYSIGKILYYDILEYVFSSNIADVFDLGAGRYPWKFEWTGTFSTTYKFKKKLTIEGKPTGEKVRGSQPHVPRTIWAVIKKRLAKVKKKIARVKKKSRYPVLKRWAANQCGRIMLSSYWGKKQLLNNLPETVPERIDLPQKGKAVIIAPHPDDEIFGCGLLLGELKKNNWEITVLFITRGDAYSAKSGCHDLRKEEAESSAQRYGALTFWMGYRDKTLEHCVTDLSADLGYKLSQFAPDLLVIPYFADYHSDHRGAAAAAFRAIIQAELPQSVSVYLYSTFSPLVPVDGITLKYLAGDKLKLLDDLKQYKHSTAPVNINSWLLLRSITARRYLKKTDFWEPYFVFSVEELAKYKILNETWPQIFPKLVQPQFWKDFVLELQKISSIINNRIS
ncbi:MAG: GNAT family N-acetyltransferase [Bacteroidales bacterium]